MKKSILAGALAVVMLAAVVAAGCTSPTTSSPTPTPSASTTTTAAEEQAIAQYLATMMQQLNFTVVSPFSLQPSTQTGIAVYNGTVSDNNGTYAVSVQAYNNTQTSQAQFLSLRTMFMGQGYATVQQNATTWSGFNASARRGAAVEYGSSPLMPYYGMVITGGAVGQAPFQQAMWQHMWDDMHERMGNGGGMGPYMGYGMNASTRSQMQQEMQEHMGAMGQ
ncbi:MAG: hypothetical protein ABSB81_02600 [Halobacteriota archaeon]|jgi:hypothetical protein